MTDERVTRVLDGLRYDTDKATLVAQRFADRWLYLYRTDKGRYFIVDYLRGQEPDVRVGAKARLCACWDGIKTRRPAPLSGWATM
jgi:hypothetical protein